ncbi:MAG: VWA domain-containing protein [Blastocatellia bacterium]
MSHHAPPNRPPGVSPSPNVSPDRRLSTRWRLVLGDSPKAPPDSLEGTLPDESAVLARTLDLLYGGSEESRAGGRRPSLPVLADWLRDIRLAFPAESVRLLQQEALARLDCLPLLLEPEIRDQIWPSAELAAALLSLSRRLPARTRELARRLVRQIVDSLAAQLSIPLEKAVEQAQRQARPRSPRSAAEIDWPRTIRANLRHYQPDRQILLPVRLHGRSGRQTAWRQVVVCLDQSASMLPSTVYAGIYASVLARLPALSTHLVAFDTEVVDLSSQAEDPLDILFGLHLGGGTDLQRALDYCDQLITSPEQAVLLLVSDLHHAPALGASLSDDPHRPVIASAARLVSRGVTVLCLLALDDQGTPTYHHALAESLATLGITILAAPPDQFPPLLAAALARSSSAR